MAVNVVGTGVASVARTPLAHFVELDVARVRPGVDALLRASGEAWSTFVNHQPPTTAYGVQARFAAANLVHGGAAVADAAAAAAQLAERAAAPLEQPLWRRVLHVPATDEALGGAQGAANSALRGSYGMAKQVRSAFDVVRRGLPYRVDAELEHLVRLSGQRGDVDRIGAGKALQLLVDAGVFDSAPGSTRRLLLDHGMRTPSRVASSVDQIRGMRGPDARVDPGDLLPAVEVLARDVSATGRAPEQLTQRLAALVADVRRGERPSDAALGDHLDAVEGWMRDDVASAPSMPVTDEIAAMARLKPWEIGHDDLARLVAIDHLPAGERPRGMPNVFPVRDYGFGYHGKVVKWTLADLERQSAFIGGRSDGDHDQRVAGMTKQLGAWLRRDRYPAVTPGAPSYSKPALASLEGVRTLQAPLSPPSRRAPNILETLATLTLGYPS